MTLSFAPSTFGLYLDYPFPPDCNAVVICVDLDQHQPVTICLTHQVYREKLRKLLLKYPQARSFTIIPYRSAEKIVVPLSVVKQS